MVWQVAIRGPRGLLGEGLARLLEESGYRVIAAADTDDGSSLPDEEVDLVLADGLDNHRNVSDDLHAVSKRFPRAKIVLLVHQSTDLEMVRAALVNGAQGCIEETATLAAMLSAIDAVLHGQIVCPPTLRNWLVPRSPRADAPELQKSRAPVSPEPVRPTNGPPASGAPVRPEGRAPVPPTVERHDAPTVGSPASPDGVAHGPAPALRPDTTGKVSLSERETEILRYLTHGDANKVIARCLDISEATVKSHLKSLLRKLNFQNRTQAAIWAISNGRFASQESPGRGGVSQTPGRTPEPGAGARVREAIPLRRRPDEGLALIAEDRRQAERMRLPAWRN